MDIYKTVRKYEILRVLYKAAYTFLKITKSIFVLWLPYLGRKPQRIRFFPIWLFSFRPGAAPFKEGMPLITYEAMEWLDFFLTKDMNIFEYGSGGSTLFIAKRVREIVSVEHDEQWYHLLFSVIKKNDIPNCTYIFESPTPDDTPEPDYSDYRACFSGIPKYHGYSFAKYCQAIERYPDQYFDFVFIDGRARPSCLFYSIKKIKPGGYLLVDDSDRGRYKHAMGLLNKWKPKIFIGPKGYVDTPRFYQTSIWQKPIH